MVEVENNIPEISIIMPVYNSETFLYLAVESVKEADHERMGAAFDRRWFIGCVREIM